MALNSFFTCYLALVQPVMPQSQLAEITVSSGQHQRVNSPVSVELGSDLDLPETFQLMEMVNGIRIPVPSQVEQGDPARLWWILSDTTGPGEERTFILAAGIPAQVENLTVAMNDVSLDVLWGDNKVLSYNHGTVPLPAGVNQIYGSNSYIHPLYSPSGMVVTEDYPADHRHHHGIWMPWTKVSFEGRQLDMWNLPDNLGRVAFNSFNILVEGPVYAGFISTQDHIDLTQPKVALNEEWDVRVWKTGGPGANGYWLWDITSSQHTASSSPFTVLQYHYSGFGYRGAVEWTGQLEVLTSKEDNLSSANGTKAKWNGMQGQINSSWAHVVVMTHPDNFRFPEPSRYHVEGNPYFGYVPPNEGAFTIEPGIDFVRRYRFFVKDGKMDAMELDRVWNDFGEPPAASINKSLNLHQQQLKVPPKNKSRLRIHQWNLYVIHETPNSKTRVININGRNATNQDYTL